MLRFSLGIVQSRNLLFNIYFLKAWHNFNKFKDKHLFILDLLLLSTLKRCPLSTFLDTSPTSKVIESTDINRLQYYLIIALYLRSDCGMST